MAETLVKICGLQDVEVLKSMLHLPLDYIGFVFAPSRRKVSIERAAELIAELPNWKTGEIPKAAGVFVNPELDELNELLSVVHLDVIQLHGQESPAFCQQVRQAYPQVQVWKALSVADQERDKAENEYTLEDYEAAVDAVLLDTYDPLQSGGSGRTFAWNKLPEYQEIAVRHGLPLFVAGGLHSDNVGELLDTYVPYGVDVSSGVETDGIKDIQKMTAFVERVKQS
ncbi:phosphoribosylanthranilate isomerase [Paenibacillus sp. FSL L8-0493]|uniref:phosphoribosylanthranilate isomerase n=1 Tax=Paenibacillus TaxID=44249 RepID=UPI00096E52BE|nr:phosphoribosylanthranilate isomerase [Paenibacillus odorifer]OMD01479.1 N-(5'-phosphoribosyl)anthranilate isomerase [Paenibacillus odorifer]OMD06813.1 N-(5'-phosphoribosyl)anthranilate isomerase [Paenibacillus odorifer]